MSSLDRVKEIAEKIKSMEIRGAANIGRAAARALMYYAEDFDGNFVEEFMDGVAEARKILESTRPSAVTLFNAIRYVFKRMEGRDVNSLRDSVIKAAKQFIENSEKAIERIGRFGAERIPPNSTVMTHCNSSAALGAIITAHLQGKNIEVIATETRPWYQGHITVKRLAEEGIPVTLIVDSAMRYFMKDVDIVMVGADTVASNGAVINKIGTSLMALCAHEARVPFIVCAETYKFSPETVIGKLVKIEERDVREVADPKEFSGVKIRNPVFDATPPEYIDAIITEKGVISPYLAYEIIKEEFGVSL